MTLATAFEREALFEEDVLTSLKGLAEEVGSDTRLQIILASLVKRGPDEVRSTQRAPMEGTIVKSTQSSVTVTVQRAGDTIAFADWFDENIDRLIEESYRSFQENSEDEVS